MPHWTAWIYGPMIIVAIAFVLTRYVFPAVIRGDGEHGAAPPTGTRLAPPPTGTRLAPPPTGTRLAPPPTGTR
ncbi:MAG: hypothetical protein ACRDTB_19080, partial [Actinophytocola sp.]